MFYLQKLPPGLRILAAAAHFPAVEEATYLFNQSEGDSLFAARILDYDGQHGFNREKHLKELRRVCGIPRARVAAAATIYASTIANYLCRSLLRPACEYAVVVATTTATTHVAYEFEMRGLVEGWQVVDPLALPHTIPNAISSQVSIAHKLKAAALTLMEGITGPFHAIEVAALSLVPSRAAGALVIAAEERTAFHEVAFNELALKIRECEGAAGLLLGQGNGGDAGCWRIDSIARGASNHDHSLMCSEIKGKDFIDVRSRSELDILCAHRPLVRLQRALSESNRDFVITAFRPNGQWIAIGVTRDSE